MARVCLCHLPELYERKNPMIATEEKLLCIPLCPVHLTAMRGVDLKVVGPDGVRILDGAGCPEPCCVFTFSRTIGYCRFYEGVQFQSEKSFWFKCPEHRRPLYISDYDEKDKTATWRCPDTHCQTEQNRRLH